MSSVIDTYIDKAEFQKGLMEIDRQLVEVTNDKTNLQQRLKEINTKIQILTEKKEEITLMMLSENFGNKKKHPSTGNNSNEKNNNNISNGSIEKAANNKIVEEDDKKTNNLSKSTINTTTNSVIQQDDKNIGNSSSQTNSNTRNYNILEEEEEEVEVEEEVEEDDDANYEEVDVVKFENSEIFQNYDSLKQFFEETQNVDSYGVEIEYTGDQVSDLSQKKVACLKMFIFRAGRFIDFYDHKIKKALYYADIQTGTLAQYKASRENLFDTLIERSKVLDLYDKCGEKAGELYEQIKEVSLLQIWSKNKHFYYMVILTLLTYSNCKNWSYEKIKAVCEFWQAGVVSELKLVVGVKNDFYVLYYKFLNSLGENNKLTEDERETILSILQVTKNYCNK